MQINRKTEEQYIDKLNHLWEANKSKVKKDLEGEYIVFDNRELSNSGIPLQDLKAPGNFRSFSAGRSKYILHGFETGHSRLFKKL